MACVGVDVSKDFVDVDSEKEFKRVQRTRVAMREYFSQLPQDSCLILEATGRLHRLVMEVAQECGLKTYCVNPYLFSMYRRSVKPRAKTDRIDAQILRRYGDRELDVLRESRLGSPQLQRLKDLLELRETQVKLKVSWEQAQSEITPLPAECRKALKQIEKSIQSLEKEIHALAKGDELYEKFCEMDGVAQNISPALVWLFRTHDFKSEDQVVAFVGMDLRIRESGRFIGQRKLTKRGPTIIRRMIHCSANSCRRIKELKPLFEKQHKKGLRVNGVNMIIGRKILRTAFLLATTSHRYDRKKFAGIT